MTKKSDNSASDHYNAEMTHFTSVFFWLSVYAYAPGNFTLI